MTSGVRDPANTSATCVVPATANTSAACVVPATANTSAACVVPATANTSAACVVPATANMSAALTVPIPASKSMTQRALFIGMLADGPSTIVGALDCDDSRHLARVLEALGATLAWTGDAVVMTPPAWPLGAPESALFCGNAGTAIRFSAALSLVVEGTLILDGDERMRARPIGPLGDALTALGVEVRYLAGAGYPPIALTRTAAAAPTVRVDASSSSQFASALIMVAPRLPHGLVVELTGETVVSRPYLELTLTMMRRAGARAEWEGENRMRIHPGNYRSGSTTVEPDWSAAGFILAAARITGHTFEPRGRRDPAAAVLGDAVIADAQASRQGDAVIAELLAQMDTSDVNRFDLTGTPDLIAPLAAAALFAARPTEFRGAHHARIKECDRIHVLARELAKLGAIVTEHWDGLDITPLALPVAMPPAMPPIRDSSATVMLDPDDDHRMAMAFGVISLRMPWITVKDPACVSKSFPDFWAVLATMRERVARTS
ncbi:MAG: 3-phosphoshikimate 1-carboxyvinyltransferase [Myxococcales bacterium]|nr:3-phosphoshikimate 1-carboxyvinyltransferase [Myxococcales bacterium]